MSGRLEWCVTKEKLLYVQFVGLKPEDINEDGSIKPSILGLASEDPRLTAYLGNVYTFSLAHVSRFASNGQKGTIALRGNIVYIYYRFCYNSFYFAQ